MSARDPGGMNDAAWLALRSLLRHPERDTSDAIAAGLRRGEASPDEVADGLDRLLHLGYAELTNGRWALTSWCREALHDMAFPGA